MSALHGMMNLQFGPPDPINAYEQASPMPKLVPLGARPHAADCAVHNGSAGPCDCGAVPGTTKGQVPGPPGHNPFRDFPTDRRRIGG